MFDVLQPKWIRWRGGAWAQGTSGLAGATETRDERGPPEEEGDHDER